MTDLMDLGLGLVGLALVAIAIGEFLGRWIKRGRRWGRMESSPGGGQPMMRLTSLLVAFSLLTSAATAYAECSWRVRWPNDDRMWAVPWGTVPRGSFVTRTACERAIENMLQEAIRAQALLIEAPACVCVPGRDDLARSLLLGPRWLARDDYQRLDRVGARRELAGDAVEYPAVMGANFNPRGARSLVNNG